MSGDTFTAKIAEALARRASYVCSNPNCRALTIAPSDEDPVKVLYIGEAAHITAASPGGARYDPDITTEQRSAPENGVFLCASCATMIDKNGGLDFSVSLLRQWKSDHEKWVRMNLNKSPQNSIVIVDGTHVAEGSGTVTGLDITGPALLRPGTFVSARGEGTVTGTRIGGAAETPK